jgi:5-methylcytosine-specific restriction endonuclease McrA
MRGSPRSGTRRSPPSITAEHRAHLSASRMGHVVSAETRAKLSARFKGRSISAEQRAKMSTAKTGKSRPPFTAETRAKMSAARIGMKFTEEHCAAMRAANLGKVPSAETIAKRLHTLISHGGRRVYSPEEQARKAVERAKRWALANPQRALAHGRKCANTRRARKLAAFVEVVDPQVVFDRDGGICGICRTPVEDDQRWDVDHVIPLAKGGQHSYANVQLAHASCNKKKATRIAA